MTGGLNMQKKTEFMLSKWNIWDQKKALLIKGFRQVGKSSSIQMFGNPNYNHLLS